MLKIECNDSVIESVLEDVLVDLLDYSEVGVKLIFEYMEMNGYMNVERDVMIPSEVYYGGEYTFPELVENYGYRVKVDYMTEHPEELDCSLKEDFVQQLKSLGECLVWNVEQDVYLVF